MDNSTRRDAISIARTFVYKKNPTEEEIEFAISQLPPSGYKVEGIRSILNKRLAAIRSGKIFRPWK